jgi:DNA-binding NarL/FixJ family response regulator
MLIMIVDRDAKRRVGLCTLLSKQGHKLMVIRNRTDAVTILRGARSAPKLILLDPNCGGVSPATFLQSVMNLLPSVKILPLAAGAEPDCGEMLSMTYGMVRRTLKRILRTRQLLE